MTKLLQDRQSLVEVKKVGVIRRIFRLVLQVFVLAVILLFSVLFVFRWVPIPTSSFIYQQNALAAKSPKIYEPAEYQWVSIDKISPQLKIAVIASEDQRFINHWGIDIVELKKALFERRRKENLRGASSITQQLAKNLFLWGGRSYTRKVLEAGLAVSIEMVWPKERILEVYLNVAQFGDAIFGAQKASELLFDKQPINLTRDEAALLAAVLPRPAVSDVNDPRPKLVKRKKWILKQMKQLGGLNHLKKLK